MTNYTPSKEGGSYIKTLSIDIETYSGVDLKKCGVYKYAEAPDFEILLFGYSIDGGEVQVVDLARGEEIPSEIPAALTDTQVLKWAFNANFERVCLSRFLGFPPGTYLSPESWRCTMVLAAYAGLPLSLQAVGEVLALEKQKLTAGRELIRYFCTPCAPTGRNGGRQRNRPEDAPEKWEECKRYNRRDVETEREIQARLAECAPPDSLWEEYCIDQEINDRGVLVDIPLVEKAIAADNLSRAELSEAMREATGLSNPNSVPQMREWLAEQGLDTDSLGKKAVAELVKSAPPELAGVLTLRSRLAKSSVKKYQAMQNAVCADGRARGMFLFYGANRTGRWAGRLIQLQNLPRNHLNDLADMRSLLRYGDTEALRTLHPDLQDTLSQLIRTAFIPRPGKKFIVADFSAIEARVIAWYADERWRQEAFAAGKDIYCASASQMFGLPVEKNGVNGHLRQKGKIAELALGYGGSVGALKAMGAPEMGLQEEELPPLVEAWRRANPGIVTFWKDVDKAVLTVLRENKITETHGIRFFADDNRLSLRLPSGRLLWYLHPAIGQNKFGGKSVTYEGTGSTGKWERIESYGPKFVENIVQATARDLLCEAMKALRDFPIVMHIHDELVLEASPSVSVEEICKKMCTTPPWAPGLLLDADGYECEYYRKE